LGSTLAVVSAQLEGHRFRRSRSHRRLRVDGHRQKKREAASQAPWE
jgi:hypothetical protein